MRQTLEIGGLTLCAWTHKEMLHLTVRDEDGDFPELVRLQTMVDTILFLTEEDV